MPGSKKIRIPAKGHCLKFRQLDLFWSLFPLLVCLFLFGLTLANRAQAQTADGDLHVTVDLGDDGDVDGPEVDDDDVDDWHKPIDGSRDKDLWLHKERGTAAPGPAASAQEEDEGEEETGEEQDRTLASDEDEENFEDEETEELEEAPALPPVTAKPWNSNDREDARPAQRPPAAPQPPRPPQTVPPQSSDPKCRVAGFSAQEISLCETSNRTRARSGAGPLQLDKRLSHIAMMHAKDMHARGYFNHDSPDKRSTFQRRIESSGVQFGAAAENLAKGHPNSEAVVRDWLKSQRGHREALLRGAYRKTGVAYYQGHWVQVFTD